MSGRKITIAICGQVRQRWFFVKCLEPLVALLRAGTVRRVLFVTWADEIAAHGPIAELLVLNGVEIVALPEPPMASSGNHLQQTRTARAALAACDADEWLLRTRGDIFYEDPAALARLLHLPLEPGETKPLPAIFRNRVWLPAAVLLSPFYAWDTTLYGRADDLGRLYRYDVGEDVEADPRAPRLTPVETRLFMRPFLDAFPIVAAWRRLAAAGRLHFATPDFAREVGIALGHRVFREILAAWWLILDRYYAIGRDGYDARVFFGTTRADAARPAGLQPNDIMLTELVSPCAIADDRFAGNLAPRPNSLDGAYLNGSTWLDRLFRGDQFGEAAAVAPFLAALARTLARCEASTARSEIDALIAALNAVDATEPLDRQPQSL
jgi:hypothetical protein